MKSDILPVRRFLSNNSKLYGLLWRAKYELLRRINATKTERKWERAKKIAKENKQGHKSIARLVFKTIQRKQKAKQMAGQNPSEDPASLGR